MKVLILLFLLPAISLIGLAQIQTVPGPTPEPKPPISNWHYSDSEDKMGRGFVRTATTASLNELRFGFPYSGAQHARLVLRLHPKYGKQVMLIIEKGQFICHLEQPLLWSRSGVPHCKLKVKFDDGRVRNYEAAGPSDYDPTVLFIYDSNQFVKDTLGSRRVYIEATFYREGNQVMEFNVAGLNRLWMSTDWP